MLYRAIHDANGQIFQTSIVDDDVDEIAEAALYAASGYFVKNIASTEYPLAMAAVNDDSYYVDVGATGLLVPRPAAPSPDYEWDWEYHYWYVNVALLEPARNEKMAEVLAIKAEKTVVPISYAGHLWHATADEIAKITKAYNRMQRTSAKPYGVTGWVTADEVPIFMWSAEPWDVLAGHLSNILNAIEDRDYDLGIIVDLHAGDIYTQDSVAEIMAHDVNLYWPY